jgi:cholesterol transport system auxiliary component
MQARPRRALSKRPSSDQASAKHVVAVAAIALLAAVLAGCGILPKKQPLALYAPEVHVSADPSWPTVSWQLQLPRPHAAELLDSPRIVVRPLPGELQVYKGAVWAQPAPDLLQDTLVRAFEDSGRIAGVARHGTGIAGDYELLLDLRRFDSDYAGGAGPTATIEIGAKLIDTRSNSVFANRTFRQVHAATATDIGAVAQALEQALGALTREVVGWTLVEGQRHDTGRQRATK